MMGRQSFSAALFSVASVGALVAVLALVGPRAAPAAAPEAGDAAHGAVLFAAGDCTGCHTDIKAKGPLAAGGAAIPTDFGTFYAPNITSDKTAGIGSWTLADFQRAMRKGKGKNGEYLYPAFPYTSFSQMSDADIADLWAYMKTVPAVATPSHPHEIKFPFSFRPLMFGWRILFFRQGPMTPVAGQSAEWNRGRYLSEAVAHCGECHSPRNFLGGIVQKNAYAGNPDGPDDQKAPNITSDDHGVGKMSVAELEDVLATGALPSGDYVGGGMGLVVDGTGKLSAADRHAMAVYIKSLPAHPSTPSKKKPAAAAK